jgi:hypothetical protein
VQNAHDQQPEAHIEPEQTPKTFQDASNEPEFWQNFRLVLPSTLEKLKASKRMSIKGNDLKSFVDDFEVLEVEIKSLKIKKIDYDFFIKDIDKLSKDITQIMIALNATLRVWNRYNESGLSMGQLADNDDAYEERLDRCHNFIEKLQQDFFNAKT